jgi:hypothetical protein
VCEELKFVKYSGPSDASSWLASRYSRADEQLKRLRRNWQVEALYQTRALGDHRVRPPPPPFDPSLAVAIFTCGSLRYSNREPRVIMTSPFRLIFRYTAEKPP